MEIHRIRTESHLKRRRIYACLKLNLHVASIRVGGREGSYPQINIREHLLSISQTETRNWN